MTPSTGPYSMSTARRMRSSEYWVGDGPAPSFMKKPPNTPLPESKNDGDTT